MLYLPEMALAIIGVAEAARNVALLQLHKLRLELGQLSGQPLQLELRKDVGLLWLADLLVELLLSLGRAADLQIQQVLLALHRLAFKIAKHGVGLLRLNRLLVDLRLQVHHLDLGLQKLLGVRWINLARQVHAAGLSDLVDALQHAISCLLGALHVLSIQVALVRLLSHVAHEHFHVVFFLLNDFALRRRRFLLAHSFRIVPREVELPHTHV